MLNAPLLGCDIIWTSCRSACNASMMLLLVSRLINVLRQLQVHVANKAHMAGVEELLKGTDSMEATLNGFSAAMGDGTAYIAACQGQVSQATQDAMLYRPTAECIVDTVQHWSSSVSLGGKKWVM